MKGYLPKKYTCNATIEMLPPKSKTWAQFLMSGEGEGSSSPSLSKKKNLILWYKKFVLECQTTEIKSILLETYLKVVLNTSIGFLANIYMQVFLLIDQNRSFFIFRKVCFLILLFWFALWDRWYGVEMRVTRGLRNCIWQAKR